MAIFYHLTAFMAPIAALFVFATPAVAAQQTNVSGTVFALLDNNEWCPGGSVYVDLKTGAFMTVPRVVQPACSDGTADLSVERGALGSTELSRLQAAYREARIAGLRRGSCELVVSNGGPQVVVITAPGYSAVTPEELGCWSAEATKLYDELFKDFGKKRLPR